MKHAIAVLLALSSTAALAEETRQVDAHEHGVGTLNISFEGNTVAMEFLAPGADIVGFEYEAKSAKDRTAIENAVAALAHPSELFVLPAAAECTVTKASAALESEEEHDDDHKEHDDEEHDDEAVHTEFHAAYQMTCANPDAITDITFAYFGTFENAREVEVQIVTASEAKAFEVERGAPVLDLRGLF